MERGGGPRERAASPRAPWSATGRSSGATPWWPTTSRSTRFKNIEPGSDGPLVHRLGDARRQHPVRAQRRPRPRQRGRHARDGHAPRHVLRHAHRQGLLRHHQPGHPSGLPGLQAGHHQRAQLHGRQRARPHHGARWPSTASTSRAATPSGGIHVQMSLDNPEAHRDPLLRAAGRAYRRQARAGHREPLLPRGFPPGRLRRDGPGRVSAAGHRDLHQLAARELEHRGHPGQAAPPGARLLARRRRPSSSRPLWTSWGSRPSPSTRSRAAGRGSRSRRACRRRRPEWGRWSGPWRPTWAPSSIRGPSASTWSTRRAV